MFCARCELSPAHLPLATSGNKVCPLSANCCPILGHNRYTMSMVCPWWPEKVHNIAADSHNRLLGASYSFPKSYHILWSIAQNVLQEARRPMFCWGATHWLANAREDRSRQRTMRSDFCTGLGAIFWHPWTDILWANTWGDEFIWARSKDHQPQPPQDHQLPNVQDGVPDVIQGVFCGDGAHWQGVHSHRVVLPTPHRPSGPPKPRSGL